jgi:hypothetical protein
MQNAALPQRGVRGIGGICGRRVPKASGAFQRRAKERGTAYWPMRELVRHPPLHRKKIRDGVNEKTRYCNEKEITNKGTDIFKLGEKLK